MDVALDATTCSLQVGWISSFGMLVESGKWVNLDFETFDLGGCEKKLFSGSDLSNASVGKTIPAKKMTVETSEVRSDRKQREERREREKLREIERKREKWRERERKRREKGEKKREKREKKREKEKKDVQGQLLSICIQFSKRKNKYIGRNAPNFKKWLRTYNIYRHYKSSCQS